jgi:hypothetical protein
MNRQPKDDYDGIKDIAHKVNALIKYARKNHIPNDYKGLIQLRDKLRQEAKERYEMNQMRGEIDNLIRQKKSWMAWEKRVRREKIRKTLERLDPREILKHDD